MDMVRYKTGDQSRTVFEKMDKNAPLCICVMIRLDIKPPTLLFKSNQDVYQIIR